MLFTDYSTAKIRRSSQEFEDLKEKADIKSILVLLDSMKIKLSVVNNLERWERDFLKERAKDLGIKGMTDFLNFRDFSWIKKGEYLPPHQSRKCEIGRGLIPGSVALPPATKIGGFVYHGNQKRKKRDSGGKVYDVREVKKIY